MTARETIQRIGSLEMRRRLGPNLIRGLIASVFLHSAIVSIGLIEWGEKAEKPGFTEGADTLLIPIPRPDRDFVQVPPRPQRPVLDKIEIPIAVPEEPPVDTTQIVEKTPPDPLDYKYGIPTESEEGNGAPGGDFAGTIVDSMTLAGSVKPWEIFVPTEIPPYPLSYNPNPVYPDIARKSGISAKVLVWVLVGVDGKVKDWNIIDVTVPGLGFEEAVMDVVPKWEFTPAIQGKRPVEVWVCQPFVFKIKH